MSGEESHDSDSNSTMSHQVISQVCVKPMALKLLYSISESFTIFFFERLIISNVLVPSYDICIECTNTQFKDMSSLT